MAEEYKRPTRVIDLPSGKKVELIEYFTAWEIEEIQGEIAKGVMVDQNNGEAVNEAQKDKIPMSNLLSAYRKAKEIAVKKLFDETGKEYVATEENMKEFLNVEDGEVVTAIVTEMMGKKK